MRKFLALCLTFCMTLICMSIPVHAADIDSKYQKDIISSNTFDGKQILAAFEVTPRKLLGFIISQWGTEIDLNKIKVVIDMPPSSNIRQLQSLQGKIQAIRCFILQLSNKCKFFTKLLKKGTIFHWGKEWQDVLNEIK